MSLSVNPELTFSHRQKACRLSMICQELIRPGLGSPEAASQLGSHNLVLRGGKKRDKKDDWSEIASGMVFL